MSPRAAAWLTGIGAAAALSGRPATAQTIAATWEGNRVEGYAFADVMLPLVRRGGGAFFVAITPNYLYYHFPDSSGRIRVGSPGLGVRVGGQVERETWTATISAGYEVRRTSYYDAVGGQPEREGERGLAAEASAELMVTPLTTLEAELSVSGASGYVWSRAGALQQIAAGSGPRPLSLELGADFAVERTADSHAWHLGPRLAVTRGGTTLDLRAGRSRLSYPGFSREGRWYFGAGISYAF